MAVSAMITAPTITNIFSIWKLEIFNCLLAIAMLGSMYGIVQRYDGQRVPDWNIHINLSTLIALITVIFRMSLVLILAELIGQAKWKYFVGNGRKEPPVRRLIETSRFNDASQGLFGALKLIPTIMGHPDILLAILVMVVSLGTGAFVQQSIQTQPCQFSTDSIDAYLPVSRKITRRESTGKQNWATMAAAISSALAPDNNEVGSPILAGCSTGNCTFHNSIGGLYNTLGVCNLCTDTSSLITSTQHIIKGTTLLIRDYTLPNGLTVPALFENETEAHAVAHYSGLSVSALRLLHPENPYLLDWSDWTGDLDWAGDIVSPEMRALSQWAFANVTVLTSNWLPTSLGYTEYLAVTCTLYPCLRTYNASVTMGKLDEVLLNTVPMAPNVNGAASNDAAEAILQAPSWPFWEGTLMGAASRTSLQAVQSPCLVNQTASTEDNILSNNDQQNLILLQADPSPSKTRRVKIENITAPTDCIYGIDLKTWQEVMGSMLDAFNGSCSIQTSTDGTDVFYDKSYWLSSFYKDNGITTSDIFEQFQAFADRFSNKIRMGLLDNPDYIFGQTIQTTVCVNISYKWLLFPTVLVFITSGLLAWTMFCNWRRGGCKIVWKTSILPFLFYSERFVVQNGEDMSAESTQSSRGATKEALMDLDQMQSEAKQQVVRFHVSN